MSELTPEQRNLKTGKIQEALAMLRPHFSSIQILATHDEGPCSVRYNQGAGDFYARYGNARLWVQDQELITEGILEDEA